MARFENIKFAATLQAWRSRIRTAFFGLVGIGVFGGTTILYFERQRPSPLPVSSQRVPSSPSEKHDDIVYADGTRYQWDGRAYRNSGALTPASVPAETKVHRRIEGSRLGGRGNLLQEGMRVEVVNFVKCFRYDLGEYRCFRTFGEQTGVIIIRDLKREHGASLDASCSTLKRAMSNRACWYKIEFDLVQIGSDHMETTRMYLGENVDLTPA